MRVTPIHSPVPETGCVPDGFHPTGFVEAPHRFLERRLNSYFDEQGLTPVESQWAGKSSAFLEGLLIQELRAVACDARDDPTGALAKAATARVDGDDERGRAFADLAVTGRAAFEPHKAVSKPDQILPVKRPDQYTA